MSDDHEGTLGERLAARLAHIADAMEKGEPLKSTTVVRVGDDEAALRIIVRQQRAEIDRLAAEVEKLRTSRGALTLALQRAIDFVPVPEEAVRAADAQRVICDALRNHGGAA
jgi:hypothetical protein